MEEPNEPEVVESEEAHPKTELLLVPLVHVCASGLRSKQTSLANGASKARQTMLQQFQKVMAM